MSHFCNLRKRLSGPDNQQRHQRCRSSYQACGNCCLASRRVLPLPQMAPRGQWLQMASLGRTRRPWKRHLPVLLSAKWAHSAVGLQGLLKSCGLEAVVKQAIGYACLWSSVVSVPNIAFKVLLEMKRKRLKWQCNIFLIAKYFRTDGKLCFAKYEVLPLLILYSCSLFNAGWSCCLQSFSCSTVP